MEVFVLYHNLPLFLEEEVDLKLSVIHGRYLNDAVQSYRWSCVAVTLFFFSVMTNISKAPASLDIAKLRSIL